SQIETELGKVAEDALTAAVEKGQLPGRPALPAQMTAVEDQIHGIYKLDPRRPAGWPEVRAAFTRGDNTAYVLSVSGLQFLRGMTVAYNQGNSAGIPTDELTCIVEAASDSVSALLRPATEAMNGKIPTVESITQMTKLVGAR